MKNLLTDFTIVYLTILKIFFLIGYKTILQCSLK